MKIRTILALAGLPLRKMEISRLPDISQLSGEEFFKDDPCDEWKAVEKSIQGVFEYENIGEAVAPAERKAIWYLIRRLQPQSVLEIGTHTGGSTLHIAMALKDLRKPGLQPRLVTVDRVDVNDPVVGPWVAWGRSASPRDMLIRLGCEREMVDFVHARSLDYLCGCEDMFDFIFLDGSHKKRTLCREIPMALRVLRPGGCVLLHDYHPRDEPLWTDEGGLPLAWERGPYLAIENLRSKAPGLAVLPLGKLPWQVRPNSNATCLAFLARERHRPTSESRCSATTMAPTGRSFKDHTTSLTTRALRIAFVLPDLRGGGAERMILRTARGLMARGHEVDFVLFGTLFHYPDETPPAARLFVLNDAPDDMTRERAPDILNRCITLLPGKHGNSQIGDYMRLLGAVRRRPFAPPNGRWLKEARFIASYVSDEKPDCIVPVLPRDHIATLWSKSLTSTFPPIIPTIHSVLRHEKRKTKCRYRLLLGRSGHVVTVSEGVRDDVLAVTGIPRDRISTIYNPAVTPGIDALQREVPDHPWMTDSGPPIVLSAGRLTHQKDHPTLLRAFHDVSKTRSLRLIILGEGEQRKQLEALVRELGIQDSVSLPGWSYNIFPFMSRASLFVLSSKYEGLPTVLIEALACGCPCVSTDCPHGPSEILEGGRMGSLVAVGDHAALAGAMRDTLDKPPGKEALRERAKFFSMEKSVGAYEGLIVEIVRRHGNKAESNA